LLWLFQWGNENEHHLVFTWYFSVL